MEVSWCWHFTIIFTIIFAGLGVLGTIYNTSDKISRTKVWLVSCSLYFMVMFQMYLIYMHPPPGKNPEMPCWLKIWIQ
ncbi:hypothetical protein UR09_02840 [Candidatus Nitromaritima sp. SCGC AAA799-A02]|nr:hypothetical protein UZ36_03995 [Candidatus Nitromaritima sp. SCGC AAA799-C22]KMP11621.1 hypothetical protein UR09_02840 [Candidatus Nitromaritima sp. SCGC AAA799-A02]